MNYRKKILDLIKTNLNQKINEYALNEGGFYQELIPFLKELVKLCESEPQTYNKNLKAIYNIGDIFVNTDQNQRLVIDALDNFLLIKNEDYLEIILF